VTQPLLYTLCGLALVALGLYAFLTRRHLVRRIVALNVLGSGVFLVFGAMASRGGTTDPVPQALVITGIVVAVATTALALALALRLFRETGRLDLDAPPGGEDGSSGAGEARAE